jgi:hypothetical protein
MYGSFNFEQQNFFVGLLPPGESRTLSDLAIQADGLMGATCFSTPHMNKIPRMRVSLWDGAGGREREREKMISRIPMTWVGTGHGRSLYPQFLACLSNSIFLTSNPFALFVSHHSWWGMPVFVHVHEAANNCTSIEIRN